MYLTRKYRRSFAAALVAVLLFPLIPVPVFATGGSGNSGWWSMPRITGGGFGGGFNRPTFNPNALRGAPLRLPAPNGGWYQNGNLNPNRTWNRNGNWNKNGNWNQNGNWNRGTWTGGTWNPNWNKNWNKNWNWNKGWGWNWNGGRGWWWNSGGWWHNGWRGGWWGWGCPWWCCNNGWGSGISIGFGYPLYPYYAYPYPTYVTPAAATGDTEAVQEPTGPAPQTYWYYCSNPKGYYPYVQSCSTGWKAVPTTPPGVTQPE